LSEGRQIAKTKAEERQQKLVLIRRKRRNQIAIIAAAVFVVLIGAFELYHSGLFNVTKVEITGNKAVPAAKIAQVCNVDQETNLLSVSTEDIRNKLLKEPWIKDVAVKRALPHTLKVELVERMPAVLISFGGKFYLVDEDLFVVAERQYADGANVPTVTDLPVAKIKVGDKLMNESLDNAVKCLKSMDPELRKTIVLISAPSVDKLSLYNKDNMEILYGEAKQADQKNKVLQSILKEQGRQVIFIDIRSYPHSDPVLRRIDSVP